MQTPLAHDTVLQSIKLLTADGDTFLIDRSSAIHQLDPLAATLLELMQTGVDMQQAATLVAVQTGVSAAQVERDITKLIETVCRPQASATIPALCSQASTANTRALRYSFVCQIHTRRIKLRFNDKQAFEHNALLLSPMRIADSETVDHIVDCELDTTHCALWVDHQPYIASPELAWFHGLIRRCLIELSYGNSNTLLTLHASAMVNDDNDAIVFIAPSGAGKSSLARYLCTQGYRYMGDDSIPVDLRHGTAFALATGISLKPGSWGLDTTTHTGELQPQTLTIAGKTLKIWLPKPHVMHTVPTTIRAVVFSRYDTEAKPQWQALSLPNAIQALNNSQTRFNPNTSTATSEACIQWLARTPCFELRYQQFDEVKQALTRGMATLR